MIRVKQLTIDTIPLVELVLEEKDTEVLPTVVFYHGWTSTKESVLVNGYELAKRGIRAILPEAYLHGERDETGKALEDQTVFWRVVSQNITELPSIYNWYVQQGRTDPSRFGVSGLSMGGITTCALLTQFDFIHSAVVLMGSPSPVLFTNWLLQSKWVEGKPTTEDISTTEAFQEQLQRLHPIALNERPEKIAGRPVHFWHGTDDELVPFYLTEEFIETISSQTYAQNVSFSVGHGLGHKVPYRVSVEMADYFERFLCH